MAWRLKATFRCADVVTSVRIQPRDTKKPSDVYVIAGLAAYYALAARQGAAGLPFGIAWQVVAGLRNRVAADPILSFKCKTPRVLSNWWTDPDDYRGVRRLRYLRDDCQTIIPKDMALDMAWALFTTVEPKSGGARQLAVGTTNVLVRKGEGTLDPADLQPLLESIVPFTELERALKASAGAGASTLSSTGDRFEALNQHRIEAVLLKNADDSPRFYRPGGPTWRDLRSGYVCAREVQNEVGVAILG